MRAGSHRENAGRKMPLCATCALEFPHTYKLPLYTSLGKGERKMFNAMTMSERTVLGPLIRLIRITRRNGDVGSRKGKSHHSAVVDVGVPPDRRRNAKVHEPLTELQTHDARH